MTDNSQKNRPNKKNGQIKLGARFYILLGILVLFIGLLFIIPDVRAFIERLWHVMKNPDDLQQYIREEGKWAPLVFIFVQILQVIIAPIPGNVTTLVGGLLFGYTLGFIYGTRLNHRILLGFRAGPILRKTGHYPLCRYGAI